MLTAMATVSLGGTLEEKLAAIAAAGFDGVEIFENDLLSFNGTPADVRRLIEDCGLKAVTFQPFRDFEGLPEPGRTRAFARAERKFDLMGELACDLLLVCSNVAVELSGGVDRAAEDLRALGERAAPRGIRIGFEALAWGRHLNDYRDAWEVVRRADHPAVGLVLDSFHTLVRKTDLSAMGSIPRDRIFLVQVADAPLLALDYLSWSRHFRCFPGQGDLPVGDFLAALQATGFDGLVSLEIFNDRFRASTPRGVAADGRRSLLFALDDLRRAAGATIGRPSPLPPRAICRGIEFVEFALDEGEAHAFEALLAGLGFAKAGVHRSKAVSHWRQGGINLVVNSEKEGFAHSYNIVHGPCVCALGLTVDDAAEAIARAERLLDQPFSQPVGPHEVKVPAVRGLDGSLLYFVDLKSELSRIWAVDFRAVPTDGNRGAGLLGIDHVSQSMHHEEMLSWLLFYLSLLDVAKSPAQDVIDPGGVVESQAVATADGSLRLVLNASQSHRTMSARFVAGLLGSGVQHVAFATDDIFATVNRLRANGVDLLSIPQNYYEDLAARTDLSSEAIDRLQRNDVLYDAEEAGEYRQVYTASLDSGFFFEIVERRGYRGFGGRNAPIRLAAQTRLREAVSLVL